MAAFQRRGCTSSLVFFSPALRELGLSSRLHFVAALHRRGCASPLLFYLRALRLRFSYVREGRWRSLCVRACCVVLSLLCAVLQVVDGRASALPPRLRFMTVLDCASPLLFASAAHHGCWCSEQVVQDGCGINPPRAVHTEHVHTYDLFALKIRIR
jgi:hypothetical protein